MLFLDTKDGIEYYGGHLEKEELEKYSDSDEYNTYSSQNQIKLLTGKSSRTKQRCLNR